ncbi:MAG: hypothetical protein H7Z37_01915, partial [Pyrinomonadaceae bacterium]|nr:hypothetical protein [Pyrinomonadaceae bacterium]
MKYKLCFVLILTFAANGCDLFSVKSLPVSKPNSDKTEDVQNISKDYNKPQIIARIKDDAITESSGIVISRINKNVFWTHNDSGDDSFLYAFDSNGDKRGVFKIPNAENVDWEDIAIFHDSNKISYLFVGDIGDNNAKRDEITVYQIREPKIETSDAKTTKKNPRLTDNAIAIKIKYPDEQFDAESLLINPQNGDLYVVTKMYVGAAHIYKLSPPFAQNKTNVLQNIGEIKVANTPEGLFTGGEISPDGKRLVLCDYLQA